MDTTYLPVQWVYREMLEEALEKRMSGRIFYFCEKEEICSEDGSIAEIENKKQDGIYIRLDSGVKIRIDRIITLFGKPGAAYDEYDAYANACLACQGDHGGDDL